MRLTILPRSLSHFNRLITLRNDEYSLLTNLYSANSPTGTTRPVWPYSGLDNARINYHMVDIKGKGRATEPEHLEEQHWGPLRDSERWTVAGEWKASRRRAKADKRSWDYVLSSGVAGGIAGCVAKTAIAPLDRVKILFQTSNPEFQKYAGSPMGLVHASTRIYRTNGFRGLFQGHSATLLRIFPYAGVKFMTYDWAESVLIPTPEKRTPGRFFVAGAVSGVTSVLFTYPLELIRVRLAFQTGESERTTLRQAVKSIYREGQLPANTTASSSVSAFTRSIPLYPFYRGFSVSIIGMIPYAGVSFLTYGTLKRYVGTWFPYLEERKTVRDLGCGAIAGAVSQTASYPFEVIRRRMQVGGVAPSGGVSWRDAINAIYGPKGWRGFFVGLSIGYLKVIPMTSISFATWQLMKRMMEI